MSDVLSKLKRGSVDSGAEGRVREGWLMKKGQLNTEWKRRWSVHTFWLSHFPLALNSFSHLYLMRPLLPVSNRPCTCLIRR